MTAEQKRDYNVKFRMLIVAISAQLARCTAASVYCLQQICTVAATNPAGVVVPPATGAGAAAGGSE